MLTLALKALVITLGFDRTWDLAQERMSDFLRLGQEVTGRVVDNDATRSLVGMLPVTIDPCATTCGRKRPAICLRHCPQSSGNSIFRPAPWNFGI